MTCINKKYERWLSNHKDEILWLYTPSQQSEPLQNITITIFLHWLTVIKVSRESSSENNSTDIKEQKLFIIDTIRELVFVKSKSQSETTAYPLCPTFGSPFLFSIHTARSPTITFTKKKKGWFVEFLFAVWLTLVIVLSTTQNSKDFVRPYQG